MFHSLYNRSVGTQPSPGGLAENHANHAFLNWPVSYLDGFEPVDQERWRLEIMGLVARPQQFSLKDLNGFTRIQQNRRLVFADGWSYRAQWEGLVISELLHRSSPLPEAQYLIQTNLSGQTECMALKDLYAQRALFCLRMSGKALPPQYGGPLRLLVFDRYAHKGLGQIVRLELAAEPVPGFYAGKGYDPAGLIEPGDYYATDLKSLQTVKTPGEITQW